MGCYLAQNLRRLHSACRHHAGVGKGLRAWRGGTGAWTKGGELATGRFAKAAPSTALIVAGRSLDRCRQCCIKAMLHQGKSERHRQIRASASDTAKARASERPFPPMYPRHCNAKWQRAHAKWLIPGSAWLEPAYSPSPIHEFSPGRAQSKEVSRRAFSHASERHLGRASGRRGRIVFTQPSHAARRYAVYIVPEALRRKCHAVERAVLLADVRQPRRSVEAAAGDVVQDLGGRLRAAVAVDVLAQPA